MSLQYTPVLRLVGSIANVPAWVSNLPASIPNGNIHLLSAAGDTRAQALHNGNGVLEVTGAFVSPIGEIIDVFRVTMAMNNP